MTPTNQTNRLRETASQMTRELVDHRVQWQIYVSTNPTSWGVVGQSFKHESFARIAVASRAQIGEQL